MRDLTLLILAMAGFMALAGYTVGNEVADDIGHVFKGITIALDSV